MSDFKLISPMLDNFVMGEPMSSHHGVYCCPAMPKDSDSRYIVKIISIPASQVQLDALLLTGAYRDPAAAMDYFKELADGVVEEEAILKRLSRFEGFLPYDSYQVVPMEGAIGYHVYLMSPYKQSLERHFRKKPITHLGAVNLGLDLCAAMAVCRRAGYLYVDLKPGNVFLTAANEYRVGDLGFVKLDNLKYASLPDKYRSAYTPPEVSDAMSPITETIDIYAIGLILYQAFNGGKLPFEGQSAGDELPAPLYADYEMAEIILKACDPDPKQRWQDPIAMGQALIAYMQRNSVNDTPIVPPAAVPIVPESQESAEAPQEAAEEVAEAPDTKRTGELSFMDEMVSDETAPSEDSIADITYQELSDDASDILSIADDLIAHDAPEPVIAPEPIDVQLPAPPAVDSDTDAKFEFSEEDLQREVAQEVSEEDLQDEEEEEEDNEDAFPTPFHKKQKKQKDSKALKRLAVIMIVALLAAAMLFGGYYYYSNYYLQSINDLKLQGAGNQLTVILDTKVDNSLLSVVCTDTYGHEVTKAVFNGTATFNDLNPDNLYQVRVEIEGFHDLRGETTASYTTPSQTNIVSFTAVTGNEDGSVLLNFTVDGKEAESWTIEYSAEGEDTKQVQFTGHTVSINGLTLDKTYTFKLVSPALMYIVGQDSVEYTASKLVYAKDLAITACNSEGLTVTWAMPEDANIGQWTVHCYNDNGFDQVITTAETTVTFTDIDPAAAYNVAVTAEGMTDSARTYITAYSSTISNFQADTSKTGELTLSWDSNTDVPADGWHLLYNIVGSEQQEVLFTKENKAVLTPVVFGATYEFTLQASNGATVFGGTFSCQIPEAETFDSYGVKMKNMTFKMCHTPDEENWKWSDLKNSDYSTEYAVGDKASFVIKLNCKYNSKDVDVASTFVIFDENGKFVSVNETVQSWRYMWYQRYCELDIPALPSEPGNYTIKVYIKGMLCGSVDFTMTDK